METLWIVLAVVILGGAVWYFYSQYLSYEAADRALPPDLPNEISEGEMTAPESPPVPPPQAAEITEVLVEMMPSGFSPAAITVKAGDTIRFLNKDTKPRWPASAVHPTHQCYHGFDALKGIAPGESYSFTFEVKKTCGFHDHLNPILKGSITIE